MKKVVEIGFGSKGAPVPLSLSPDSEALSSIVSFHRMPGDARKALHSELVMNGAGTETLALFSEHTTNATLPGGVYSLPPYEYVLQVGRRALEEAHRNSGITEMLTALSAKLASVTGVPTVTTHGGKILEEDDIIPLPGIISTPLPTANEWALFARIRDAATAIAMNPTELRHLKRDALRRLLLLLLLASGIPLSNLIRYRAYYRFGSFVYVGGRPAYFIALLRQTDCGLGLMPIQIAQPDCVASVLAAMAQIGPVSPERFIFSDFDWDALARRRSLLRLLPKECRDRIPPDADRVLDRGATLLSLLRIGGFLTTSLRDRLWIPANYYHPYDVLDARGVARTSLCRIDGEPWTDPYLPSPKAIDRAATFDELLFLLGPKSAATGRGRPRELPAHLRHVQGQPRTWSDETWAALICHYWPRPAKVRIALLLEETAAAGKGAWARAVRIFNLIADQGKLCTARPLRLVPPQQMAAFLDRVENVHLPNLVRDKAKLARAIRQIRSLATLGVRPQEARRISPRDYSDAEHLHLMLIRGTKARRSARECSIHVFKQGPCGEQLFAAWDDRCQSSEVMNRGLARNDRPAFAGPGDETARFDLINAALRTAFAELTGEPLGGSGDEGIYTAYALRHATAVRLVQAAIDTDYVTGNFQAALALAAKSMGHTYPVFLSHYLGTAAFVLTWKPQP